MGEGPQRKTPPKRKSAAAAAPAHAPPSRPRPVQRASRICLPHHNIRNPRPRRQRFHLPGHYLIKVLRQILRRRIHRPKRLQIIHKLVIQPADNFPNHPLQFREVAQQPNRIQPRPFHRNAHPVIVPVHVLALPAISAQRMSRRKCLLHANLKHNLFLLRDLRLPWASKGALISVPSVLIFILSSPKIEPHPSTPASSRTPAETPKKSYHTPSAESGCPKAPAPRDPSLPGSAAQIPASAPAPLAAPETPRTHFARPPAAPAPVPPRSDRSAPQTAAGPQSRKKVAPPAHPRPARSSRSRTAPLPAYS